MPTLESCSIATTSFDLWMSKCGHDKISLVNFINSHWVPCHLTMGFFEATYTSGIVMVAQVKERLLSYNLLMGARDLQPP